MMTRPFLLLIICVCFNSLTSFAQSGVQPISGWNMEEKNGSYILKPGKNTEETKEFVYEILPSSQNEGKPLDDWFNTAIDNDLIQRGYTLRSAAAKKNITTNQSIASFSSEVADKKGQSWYVTYISYQRTTSECRLARVVSSPDVKFYAAYMRPAVAHFSSFAKDDIAQAKAGGTQTTAQQGPAKKEGGFFSFSADNSSITDKGLKLTDIKGLLMHLENSYAADGSRMKAYTPYMVLYDGTIYSGLDVNPYYLDLEKSRQIEPRKWGNWKDKGNAILIEWPGRNQNEKWNKDWFWASPAMNNEKLEGTFGTASGKDNEVLKLSDKPGSAVYISFNKMGEFTLFATPATDGNNGDVMVTADDFLKKDEAGTYILNDYSIELHFNNGRIVRSSFYFYLQGRVYFGIGNYVYTPKKNKAEGTNN